MTEGATTEAAMPLIHPGEHLGEFLADGGVTGCRIARAIGVSASRIHGILKGERGITPDTGLRLARYFGQSDSFWILLQAKYDTEKAQRRLGAALSSISPRVA